MNNAQRKEIAKLQSRLQTHCSRLYEFIDGLDDGAEPEERVAYETVLEELPKMVEDLTGIQEDIGNYRDEEQDKWDNLPESWQYGEKGETLQAGIDALTEAADAVGYGESDLRSALAVKDIQLDALVAFCHDARDNIQSAIDYIDEAVS